VGWQVQYCNRLQAAVPLAVLAVCRECLLKQAGSCFCSSIAISHASKCLVYVNLVCSCCFCRADCSQQSALLQQRCTCTHCCLLAALPTQVHTFAPINVPYVWRFHCWRQMHKSCCCLTVVWPTSPLCSTARVMGAEVKPHSMGKPAAAVVCGGSST
jgi:hypothetical protein